jgi:hypothetical protein
MSAGNGRGGGALLVPGLELAQADVAEHLAAVAHRFGPAALGVVDLPVLETSGLVGAQVRVTGVLYWAFELEQAGLVPFVEALAEGIVRGTLVLPIGAAATPLVAWWRGREYRFGAAERRALFERLFDESFRQRFQVMVDALVRIGRAGTTEGIGLLEARAAAVARDLGASLSDGGTGIAAFAARNLLEQVRASLKLLQHPDLVTALGGGGPWSLVQRHAPALLGRSVDVTRGVARAIHGLRLVEWLAGSAEALNGGTLRIGRSAGVIADAEAWNVSAGGE